MGDERHSLRHEGKDLTVRSSVVEGGHNHAELLVDGVVVAEGGTEEIGAVRLEGGDVVVRVSWWWTGRPLSVALVLPHEGARDELVPFVPPAGTRRARLHTWTTSHPALWATRHVVLAGGQVLAGVLGVSLALRLVLPHVPFPHIPRPDWHLPDWNLPDWNLPDWNLPDLPDLPDLAVPGWLKLLLPLLVATVVAVREVNRRKRRRPPEDHPPTAGPET